MDVKTAIETRRAVKHFDPAHRMRDEEIRQLLALALLSPTAFNIQHWRFVVVRDDALRRDIRALSKDQSQITEAGLFIVLCADLQAWHKHPARYWRNASADMQEAMSFMIEQYYDGNPQLQRDEAMRSCGIAAMALMLAAKEMGYDSCPMDLADLDAAGKLINLPPDHVAAMYVAIGQGTQPPWPRGGQLDMAEVVFDDRFP